MCFLLSDASPRGFPFLRFVIRLIVQSPEVIKGIFRYCKRPPVQKESPGILKYPGTEIIKIKSAVPPALNPTPEFGLRLRLALVKCFRFLSLHVTYATRTALLRFRRSAPKCSHDFLRCPALSVGDANFLSVSENQSLVHSLYHFNTSDC